MEIPLVSIGKDVEAQETGSWRALRPVVKSKCNKCGLCVLFCPDGVIFKTPNGVEIDYMFCKGCGICANECPAKAIEIVREQE